MMFKWNVASMYAYRVMVSYVHEVFVLNEWNVVGMSATLQIDLLRNITTSNIAIIVQGEYLGIMLSKW